MTRPSGTKLMPLVAALTAACSAHAATPPVALAPREQAATRKVVEEAHVADARPFEALDRILRAWIALPPDRRNEAVLSEWLGSLGEAGVPALVDALAVGGLRVEMDERLHATVETAITEALSRLDDSRALPVLRAAFTGGHSPAVRAVAARGLARSCAGIDLELLLAHAAAADPALAAAIEGLGRCLRPEAAERLASLLAAAPDVPSAQPIAAALGRLASDLVWSAPARRGDPAGVRIRLVAATALVSAVARLDDEESQRALAVVRHLDTLALIDRVRAGADAAGQARLDRAAARFRPGPR
jgi:hypothetical protein